MYIPLYICGFLRVSVGESVGHVIILYICMYMCVSEQYPEGENGKHVALSVILIPFLNSKSDGFHLPEAQLPQSRGICDVY